MTDAPQPAARPWYRLHLSTWLLLIPAVAVLLLLNIPGDEPAGLIFEGSEMVHGFPATYLRRCRDDWIYSPDEVRLAPMDPWRLAGRPKAVPPNAPQPTGAIGGGNGQVIGAEALSFSLLALLIDIAVAAGLLGAFCALAEWRRRLRKLYQFSLLELLSLTTAFAIGFGWWVAQHKEESRLVEQFEASGGTSFSVSGPNNSIKLIPRFPRWVRDLFGDERLRSIGLNRPRLCMCWTSAVQEHVKYLVDRFPSSVHVIVGQDASEADWTSIAELSSLEALDVYNSSNNDVSRIEKLANLRQLYVSVEREILSEHELTRLANLRRLERLDVRGFCVDERSIDRIDEALGRLRELKHLKYLKLSFGGGMKFSRGFVEGLASLDGLEFLGVGGEEISSDALQQMAHLKALRHLDLGDTPDAFTADDIAIFSHMPNLIRLTVGHLSGNSSRFAFDEFIKAHPDLDVHVRTW